MGDQQAAIHTALNSDHIWNKYHNSYTQAEKTGIQVPNYIIQIECCEDVIYYYRLKEPILHLLWGSWRDFSVITSPNPHLSGWNLECHGVHSHKKWGKSSHGFRIRLPKRVFFLSNAAFWPLILHGYWPFLKKRRESVSTCVHRSNISEFLYRGFSRSQNSCNGYFQWGDCARGTAQMA